MLLVLYFRNGSLNSNPSVHPHCNSLLFIYRKKKHFQQLENQFGRVERMQVFQLDKADLKLSLPLTDYRKLDTDLSEPSAAFPIWSWTNIISSYHLMNVYSFLSSPEDIFHCFKEIGKQRGKKRKNHLHEREALTGFLPYEPGWRLHTLTPRLGTESTT